jgi:hypothetical protein
MKNTKRTKKPARRAPRSPKSRRVLLTLELETGYSRAQLELICRSVFSSRSKLPPCQLKQFQANTIRARA